MNSGTVQVLIINDHSRVFEAKVDGWDADGQAISV